jgi:DNA topoisomerase-1
MAQIGSSGDKEKPKYASLLAGMSVDTLDLEGALKLFALPRTLGKFEDKVVVIGVGRFGPYVRHDGKFVSLKKTDDPLSITLDRAIELIKTKREADKKKIIKEFTENQDIRIIKDRWGRPCIKYKTKYFRLDKNVDAEKLSLDDCLKIVEIETGSTKKKKSKK